MGFNISGLVIDKSYRDNFELLENELGWKLEKQSDISFETASSNYTQEDYCDVFFTENGTILFLGMEKCSDEYSVRNANSMTFVISETVMAFSFSYYEGKHLVRSIMEVEGERLQDSGEPLVVEDNAEDTSELIFDQIDVMLDEGFGAIDMEATAERYLFVKEKKQKFSETKQKSTYEVKSRTPMKEELKTSKWWEFWK